MTRKIIDFIQRDIWRMRLNDMPRKRSFLIRNLRIVLLALRGFNEDKCSLRASALTFFSLLSIVPVFAMAFGIAKGFGLEKIMEKQLLAKFPVQNEVMTNIIAFSHTLLENTKGGLVAGVGVALLFWTVIKVLGNIESSFNDIWGIKRMRSISRRFTDYLSVMLICPILLIASGSATIFITAQTKMITEKIALLGAVSPLIGLLPYVMIWSLFIFIYIFIPNTKVNVSSAILGGITAGTLYQVSQWIYLRFQVGVMQYNAIYGSFAALPLFLVWLQLSWRIVLLGAEISFAHQNVDTYEFEPDCLNASHAFKRVLSLRLVNLVAKNFAGANKPFTAQNISHELGVPIRLVRDMIFELNEVGILSAVRDDEQRVPAYQPAVDTGLLTIKYVTDKLDNRGGGALPVTKTKELEKIRESLRSLEKLIEGSPANLLLKEV